MVAMLELLMIMLSIKFDNIIHTLGIWSIIDSLLLKLAAVQANASVAILNTTD